MKKYTPPFSLTPEILTLVGLISKEIGHLEGQKLIHLPIQLRRKNQIKTIHASLSIEGNTLSLDEMTALLDGKRILGKPQEILEVKNAINLYDHIHSLDALKIEDLLRAHETFMKDLIDENGNWRSGQVGIIKAGQMAHVAPPAHRVESLMLGLFGFIHESQLPWALKACIFHYELEFIHPFQDGNGRMGRLWQQLLLMKESSIFAYIPVEHLIKDSQEAYYAALEQSDREGSTNAFVHFSLRLVLEALRTFDTYELGIVEDSDRRLEYARGGMGANWFSRQEYLKIQKNISQATASRDLAWGLEKGILEKKGKHNQTRYKYLPL